MNNQLNLTRNFIALLFLTLFLINCERNDNAKELNGVTTDREITYDTLFIDHLLINSQPIANISFSEVKDDLGEPDIFWTSNGHDTTHHYANYIFSDGTLG